MKAAALLALLASLAVAPLAPAAVQPVSVAECAAACCQSTDNCCATACPCPPLSCHAPATSAVMLPATQPLFLFAPGSPSCLRWSAEFSDVARCFGAAIRGGDEGPTAFFADQRDQAGQGFFRTAGG